MNVRNGFYQFNIINDVEIEIHAKDLNELFKLITLCFADLIVDFKNKANKVCEVKINFEEIDILCVDYFNELIYLFDSKGFVPVNAFFEFNKSVFYAKIKGFIVNDRTKVKRILKSATYHGLELKKNSTFYLRMIVDI